MLRQCGPFDSSLEEFYLFEEKVKMKTTMSMLSCYFKREERWPMMLSSWCEDDT